MIAGLGNPGPEYRKTRHNIGFRVIAEWAASLNLTLSSRRFHSRSGRALIGGRGIILLCPQTYMNRSGMAVRACVDYYGIDCQNLLVVHDDIDLPTGRVKLTRNGSSGGHKGVQSIIEHMGTNQFPRLKVGVGRPRSMKPVDEFVLSPFSVDAEAIIEEAIQSAVRACEEFVLTGIEKAMSDVNRQRLALDGED